MCIFSGAERPVSQRPVSDRKGRPARFVQERTKREIGTTNAVATCGNDPFAFLNVRLQEKALTEEYITGCFNLNIKSSYERLCSVCARFLKYFGQPFDFEPKNKSNVAESLDDLISWFEPKVEEYGLRLAVVKRDQYNEECADIDFVVYRPCSELDYKVIVFIVSPADTLPKPAAMLYKEFIKFVSDNMCIYIGKSTDNYYLDMTFSIFEDTDQDIEELDEEDGCYLQKKRDIVAAYKDGGKFDKLFKEIRCLHPKNLKRRMEKFVENCTSPKLADVKKLFQVIIEGLPIIQKMNIHWFDFNPDLDGLSSHEDSFIEVYSQAAILYSDNDGIEEAYLRNIDNDYNCGVCPVSFNIHLWLREEMKDEHIKELMDNLDLGAKFQEWNCKFYDAVNRFDKIQEEDVCI